MPLYTKVLLFGIIILLCLLVLPRALAAIGTLLVAIPGLIVGWFFLKGEKAPPPPPTPEQIYTRIKQADDQKAQEVAENTSKYVKVERSIKKETSPDALREGILDDLKKLD